MMLADAVAPSPAPSLWADVLPIALSILSALVTWALHHLAAWLQAKAQASRWALAGSQLAGIVSAVVEEAEVSLRPRFQTAMADGKLSDDEAKALKKAVIDLLKAKLAPETLAFLQSQLGDLFDTVLGGAIEKAVGAMPPSSMVVSAPTSPRP